MAETRTTIFKKVKLFYKKLLADEQLRDYFKDIPMHRLHEKQVQFMAFAFGGASEFFGRDMAYAHYELITKQGLNLKHFDLVASYFAETLQELGVAKEVVDEAAAVVHTVRPIFDPKTYKQNGSVMGLDDVRLADKLLQLQAEEERANVSQLTSSSKTAASSSGVQPSVPARPVPTPAPAAGPDSFERQLAETAAITAANTAANAQSQAGRGPSQRAKIKMSVLAKALAPILVQAHAEAAAGADSARQWQQPQQQPQQPRQPQQPQQQQPQQQQQSQQQQPQQPQTQQQQPQQQGEGQEQSASRKFSNERRLAILAELGLITAPPGAKAPVVPPTNEGSGIRGRTAPPFMVPKAVRSGEESDSSSGSSSGEYLEDSDEDDDASGVFGYTGSLMIQGRGRGRSGKGRARHAVQPSCALSTVTEVSETELGTTQRLNILLQASKSTTSGPSNPETTSGNNTFMMVGSSSNVSLAASMFAAGAFPPNLPHARSTLSTVSAGSYQPASVIPPAHGAVSNSAPVIPTDGVRTTAAMATSPNRRLRSPPSTSPTTSSVAAAVAAGMCPFTFITNELLSASSSSTGDPGSRPIRASLGATAHIARNLSCGSSASPLSPLSHPLLNLDALAQARSTYDHSSAAQAILMSDRELMAAFESAEAARGYVSGPNTQVGAANLSKGSAPEVAAGGMAESCGCDERRGQHSTDRCAKHGSCPSLCSGLSSAYSSGSGSGTRLYDKLGSMQVIQACVHLFYSKILADPDLHLFFKGVDMDRLAMKQAVFMAYAFGGAPEYPGPSLAAVHARLVREKGLDLTHFDKVCSHFVSSLDELGVDPAAIDEATMVLLSTRPLFDPDMILQLEAEQLAAAAAAAGARDASEPPTLSPQTEFTPCGGVDAEEAGPGGGLVRMSGDDCDRVEQFGGEGCPSCPSHASNQSHEKKRGVDFDLRDLGASSQGAGVQCKGAHAYSGQQGLELDRAARAGVSSVVGGAGAVEWEAPCQGVSRQPAPTVVPAAAATTSASPAAPAADAAQVPLPTALPPSLWASAGASLRSGPGLPGKTTGAMEGRGGGSGDGVCAGYGSDGGGASPLPPLAQALAAGIEGVSKTGRLSDSISLSLAGARSHLCATLGIAATSVGPCLADLLVTSQQHSHSLVSSGQGPTSLEAWAQHSGANNNSHNNNSGGSKSWGGNTSLGGGSQPLPRASFVGSGSGVPLTLAKQVAVAGLADAKPASQLASRSSLDRGFIGLGGAASGPPNYAAGRRGGSDGQLIGVSSASALVMPKAAASAFSAGANPSCQPPAQVSRPSNGVDGQPNAAYEPNVAAVQTPSNPLPYSGAVNVGTQGASAATRVKTTHKPGGCLFCCFSRTAHGDRRGVEGTRV